MSTGVDGPGTEGGSVAVAEGSAAGAGGAGAGAGKASRATSAISGTKSDVASAAGDRDALAVFPGATGGSDGSGVVVNYHKAQLYDTDPSTLKPGQWLNDQVMVFFLEYLTHVRFKDNDGILFVHPGASMIARFESGNELAESLEGLRLPERSHVLVPVNNNPFAERAGGSHWSLLAYTRADNCFRHYDSSRGSNGRDAKGLATNLGTVISPSKKPKFKEVAAPQQTNGWDCGVYALCFAEAAAGDCTSKADLAALVTADYVSKTRAWLLSSIQALVASLGS